MPPTIRAVQVMEGTFPNAACHVPSTTSTTELRSTQGKKQVAFDGRPPSTVPRIAPAATPVKAIGCLPGNCPPGREHNQSSGARRESEPMEEHRCHVGKERCRKKARYEVQAIRGLCVGYVPVLDPKLYY
ncbi:hypothetical protein BDP55DRAFT_226138 [Colletotrichum godetiae]|uniref:Uncharacterized protein n=1 Tax=Colletotrichum godetiae TaxID=1209918 RepID=A0AAJ0ES49_9PEZI|nr:uncharacterized protein BDP55DRAFT_226138 [Colletotrichum godetiae]KAK1673492.1 hypothetical protein BDP55DRAFT_226138 [Colletotrichum godetiae]